MKGSEDGRRAMFFASQARRHPSSQVVGWAQSNAVRCPHKKRYSRRQGVSATPVAGNAATYLEQVAEAAKGSDERQGVSATPVAGNAATYPEQVAEAAKGSDEAMPCHFSRWA